MSFITIGIIKNEKDNSTNDPDKSEYLIIENEGYSFWQFENKAIGAGVDRDLLDKQFKKEFGIHLGDQIVDKLFEKEYESKDNPASVVYLITLSQNVRNGLANKDYKWIAEKALFEKEDQWQKNQQWILKHAKSAEHYFNISHPQNKSFLAKIEHLKKASEEGKLVIFVGSGISKASGVPLWDELIGELKEDINSDEKDFEIIPQLHFQEHGETNYYKRIEEILNLNRAVPNVLHKEIFKLSPFHIITTNYDSLLENESKNQGKKYYVVHSDKDLPYSNSANMIIKMHGDFRAKNIVLKEDDYLHYHQNFPLIEILVKSIFASKVVLFIGFSFGDRNLKKIIESVRHILSEKYNPVLLFSPIEQDTNKIQYFKNRGVSVIGYDPFIKLYFRDKPINSTSSLNANDKKSIETRTYNFLRFLREYSEEDKFLLSNEHVIDKMYGGLVRFYDLPAIPYNYLIRIKPFALANEDRYFAKYDPVGWKLKIEAEDIMRYLKKVKVIKNGKIYYNNGEEKDTSKNERLTYVYKKLLSSSVATIHRKYDFREKISVELTVKDEKERCDCASCLFNRFELDKAYSKIQYDDVNSHNALAFLKLSKVKFFFAEYESCYRDLKEAASIANKNNSVHLYYLCMYNIKLLRYRILDLIVPELIDKSKRDLILEEIDTISLPEVVEGFYANQLSKTILHSIGSKELYHKTRKGIQSNLDALKNLHENSSEDSMFLGPHYVLKIASLYRAYANFLSNNFLFDVYYQDFKELTDHLVKGLFIGFASLQNINQKINYIPIEDAKSIIKYADSKNLNKSIDLILAPNDVVFKFKEDEVDEIIQFMRSFVDSNININTIFQESINPNHRIEYAANRHPIVRQRLRNYFDKILLILNASAEQLSTSDNFVEFLELLLKYIKSSNDSVFSNDEYFSDLIETVIKYTSGDQILLLFETCLSYYLWSDKFVRRFTHTISKYNNEFNISDNSLLDEILLRIMPRNRYQVDKKLIFYIYRFVSPQLKPKVDEFIKVNFKADDVLLAAALYDVDLPNLNLLLEEKLLEVCSQKPVIENIGDTYYITNDSFMKILRLVILGKIPTSEETQNIILSNNNFFSWILFPSKFDYSKFEINWLMTIHRNKKILEFLQENKSPKLMGIVEEYLSENYRREISEIYWQYLK